MNTTVPQGEQKSPTIARSNRNQKGKGREIKKKKRRPGRKEKHRRMKRKSRCLPSHRSPASFGCLPQLRLQ